MRPTSSLVLALPLLILPLLAGAARAEPDLASYETVYLAACNADLGRSDCQCRMMVIEAALSHRLFAQLVARYGGDLREVLPDEAIAFEVRQRCGSTRSAAN
jgi:hypothetical protein